MPVGFKATGEYEVPACPKCYLLLRSTFTMKSIWGQNFTHFRWFYLIRSIFRYLIIKRTPVYVKNVMRTVLVVQPSFRTRAAARTESAATGPTAPAAATSTGTEAQNPGSGKFEFETKHRVSQNHGKQVWRVTHTKFHLPITQFVVIPHGQRDLSSLPWLGGAAVQISWKREAVGILLRSRQENSI